MLTPETIQAAERIIERFGFPIFVALIALLFFWAMFNYMKATVTKKDCDFLAYINSSNKQLADYVANRDAQMNAVVSQHNETFKGVGAAMSRLSDSIELRINREIRKDSSDKEKESQNITLA